MTQELNQLLLKAIIGIFTVLFLGFIKALTQWIVTHTGARGAAVAEIVARNAVQAIEQIYKSEEVHGPEKLAHAKSLLLQDLEKRGFKISDEQLTIFIESAVKEMNEGIRFLTKE